MDIEKFNLLKAHVEQYTRKDGTVVQAHDDKRQAAQSIMGVHKVGDAVSYKGARGSTRTGVVKGSRDGKVVVEHNAGYTELKHHSELSAKPAATPSLGANAKALRASSKPGELDHDDNQIAAGYMEDGDHKALAQHVSHLDTAARDHILDHVHPETREKLGFKQIDMARSRKQYAAKFGK